MHEALVHELDLDASSSSCAMAALPVRVCASHGSKGPLVLSAVQRRNASVTTSHPLARAICQTSQTVSGAPSAFP